MAEPSSQATGLLSKQWVRTTFYTLIAVAVLAGIGLLAGLIAQSASTSSSICTPVPVNCSAPALNGTDYTCNSTYAVLYASSCRLMGTRCSAYSNNTNMPSCVITPYSPYSFSMSCNATAPKTFAGFLSDNGSGTYLYLPIKTVFGMFCP